MIGCYPFLTDSYKKKKKSVKKKECKLTADTTSLNLTSDKCIFSPFFNATSASLSVFIVRARFSYSQIKLRCLRLICSKNLKTTFGFLGILFKSINRVKQVPQRG